MAQTVIYMIIWQQVHKREQVIELFHDLGIKFPEGLCLVHQMNSATQNNLRLQAFSIPLSS